jgi:hypothetical protein
VAAIARDIQTKVGKALMALQIGDITRQRIEHVQLGIEVAARAAATSDLSAEARNRAERRLLHLIADQMADTASDFEVEAAKVTRNLTGMAADTAQIMAIHGLSARAERADFVNWKKAWVTPACWLTTSAPPSPMRTGSAARRSRPSKP